MKVGFSAISHNAEMEFQLFGSVGNTGESLLTCCQTSDHVAVLMGRLYYRHDLLAAIAPHRLIRSPEGAVPR
jgi:asparagine synthase (glutamine-hydrolysing)